MLVEFSIKEDGDDFYRALELSLDEIKYYSPEIIDEYDLIDIEDNTFILDLLKEYLKENDPPQQLIL
jgi:hypothetical protein